MKSIIAAAITASLIFAASSANAQDFKTADTDADQQVTLEEANAAGLPWTEDQFLSLDTDANGTLSAEEFANAVRQ